MTQTPGGWHPDPTQPGQLRWWDGTRWTEHTAPAAPPAAYPASTAPGPGPAPASSPYGPPAYGSPRTSAATTPDGQRLAGWWLRVVATLVDGLVLTPIVLALAWPWTGRIVEAYGDYFDEALDAAERGGASPPVTDLMTDIAGPMLAVGLVWLLTSLVWTFGFLRAFGATPGKLLLGLRVRLRDTPGRLPWSAIAKRWGVQSIGQVSGFVPFVGTFGSLFSLLDVLWPLWDDKKQALHDKAAGTNVVRVR
ncbi:RDD family protein [Nocardioides sp. SYSU D00038]|uniref:RDD family protein n=1 Tax=Nocardioides sp. SYSU D00038 TaxID=2812554 RepID=UPI0019688387|nr:RDD family protein [Nocardioides sp. SYSU D00038]